MQMFQLNSQNYHSNEANQHYMSVSQFKSAIECEASVIAELKGEHERPSSLALTVGSYTHSAFESEQVFDEFVEENRGIIFNTRGGKYADFKQADSMIETIKNDRFAMFALEGEKEVIYTGELFGVQWKIKVDAINHDRKTFTDLKTTQSLSKRYWSDKYSKYVSFVEAYDYVLQMAIYREIIYQNTGAYYVPYIVAVTKETPPDKAILHFDESRFEFELEYTKERLPSIISAKLGNKDPKRCEVCEYCRATKQLNNTFEIEFLLK
ncbi:PD-(D/E)XK nuclease-like domain-containing protein [Lysinibacillus pakistanensis]|uniref:PD-(D/E)XK nuclease-like domain-containing protein n=1 Tax=Lysinibacillus pakistanensis TaxID=759811 RepID=A0AAX3WVU5_9BACI|nr:PD-(D/E)XK nuclease-like domain-containing protein [Lysinibacillus pakistanensis]WHY46998.1 PD-(D/E)XK nuclease-like domain-containing protein [Lysinibacillus pakistanensis]WHY52010.1 PD-(D/E)XK nuclease-like domain-containing protein [Lysinibacillus pakistanensis]